MLYSTLVLVRKITRTSVKALLSSLVFVACVCVCVCVRACVCVRVCVCACVNIYIYMAREILVK